MTPENYLVDLLATNGDAHKISPGNIKFVKKFILVTMLGNLRINGQAPNSRYSLANYLLDNNRVMLDFTHLNPGYKKIFKQWFLDEHKKNFEVVLQDDFKVSEYRGYSAEVKLTWLGRLKNSFLFKRCYKKLSLAPLILSANYQLNSIEVAPGKQNGLLVGFNQHGAQAIPEKYGNGIYDEEDAHLNTKRVYLTNETVEQLCNIRLSEISERQYARWLTRKHPLSISVSNLEAYYERMHEHRVANCYYKPKGGLVYFLKKLAIKLGLIAQPSVIKSHTVRNYFDFLSTKDIRVQLNDGDSEIIVSERRPMPDTFAFCGGGAKIFGHLGAIKEFMKAGIRGEYFSGSSAGAIMAMLCYIGYEPEDVEAYFKKFNSDLLVRRKRMFTRKGISKPDALKSAIDNILLERFLLIKAALQQSPLGREFLKKFYFAKGKRITFALFSQIKRDFPEIAYQYKIGKSLIVTATNMKSNETDFFSAELTPDQEISKAVVASACFPILYTPIIIGGIPYRDGGLLNNFPIELFKDDKSTFLESKYGIDFKVIGFQFDNGGVERNVLDRLQRKIYRESKLYNKLLSWLTGVDDPVSAWVKDRIKLLKYPSVIIIPVGNINATSFDISDEVKERLIQTGSKAGVQYLMPRFNTRKCEDGSIKIVPESDGRLENKELIYKRFANMEDLLNYCYHRDRRDVFDKLVKRINQAHIFPVKERRELLDKTQLLESMFERRDKQKRRGASFSLGQNFSKFTPSVVPPGNQGNASRNNSLFVQVNRLLCFSLNEEDFSQNKELLTAFKRIRFELEINHPLRSLIKLYDCMKTSPVEISEKAATVYQLIGQHLTAKNTLSNVSQFERRLSEFNRKVQGNSSEINYVSYLANCRFYTNTKSLSNARVRVEPGYSLV